MEKKLVKRDDGRYVLFYTFGETKPTQSDSDSCCSHAGQAAQQSARCNCKDQKAH